MSAPDPTAGEHVAGCHRYSGVWLCDPACPRDPRRREPRPAVAASTGTSEDEEALAEDVFGAMEALGIEDATMTDARFIADAVSHWLAAREAAAGGPALTTLQQLHS